VVLPAFPHDMMIVRGRLAAPFCSTRRLPGGANTPHLSPVHLRTIGCDQDGMSSGSMPESYSAEAGGAAS
jgi:hypothetical protein